MSVLARTPVLKLTQNQILVRQTAPGVLPPAARREFLRRHSYLARSTVIALRDILANMMPGSSLTGIVA
jgi:hypothetical protein